MASAQPPSYELVQTTAAAKRALAHVAASSFILLDLEGYRLGCAGGALSLVCVGTRKAGIFLFDAIALDPVVLQEVLADIADPRKVKFMWDARKDFSELYHGHGVSICNIIDLQLVDVLVRARETCGQDGQIWSHHMEEDQPGVHTLLSLKSVWKAHDIPNLEPKEWPRQQHEDWMKRPLPDSMLDYAARDIIILSHTHEHFSDQGYLEDMYSLTMQSVRYSTLHMRERPHSEDPFQGSGILPLEILYYPPPYVPRLQCAGCRRRLTRLSFDEADCSVAFICRVCSILRRQRHKCAWLASWELTLQRDYWFRFSFNPPPNIPFDAAFAQEANVLYFYQSDFESALNNVPIQHVQVALERGAAHKYWELEVWRRDALRRVVCGE